MLSKDVLISRRRGLWYFVKHLGFLFLARTLESPWQKLNGRKVNKSGHYVPAPVNSCSLVSLSFKKRGGRCDHEESPCPFFSSHYRGGLDLLLGLPPFLSPPFQLSLSASCFSLSPAHFLSFLSPLRPSPLAARPPRVFSNMQEGRDQWCPRRGGITQLNFDENRRKGGGRENK